MKLCGPTPCKECPWRRKAPAGWLGGLSIEWFTRRAQVQSPVACHMTVGGTGEPRLCTGYAQALANACSLPRDPQLAAEVRTAGQSPEVFRSAREFDAHHRASPLYRGAMVDEGD